MIAFDIQEKNLKPSTPILNNEKLCIIRKPLSIDDFTSRIKEELEEDH